MEETAQRQSSGPAKKFEASAARLIKGYCQKDKRQGSKDTCLIKRNLVKLEQSSLRELSYKKESVRML